MNSLNHTSPLPLHAQVEVMLREMIQNAEYQQGKLLPNEVDIAKRLGVARNTVRQAINKLVQEELLIRKKGVGTKVAKNRITTKLKNWSSFSLEMHEKGVDFVNFSVKVTIVPADTEVAAIFGSNVGTELVKLERIRGLPNEPIVYFVSYFHPRIGLSVNEDFSRPLYEMLDRDYHTTVVLSKEEIGAAVADAALAGLLQMKPGEPVLLRKRCVFDPGNRIVEYNIGYYRADRFTYSIDIARD